VPDTQETRWHPAAPRARLGGPRALRRASPHMTRSWSACPTSSNASTTRH